jgi:Fe-S-cluster-containing hydrogenase component 2
MESADRGAEVGSSVPELGCAGIEVDISRCCDCRICEVVCSFHLSGAFGPASSAISITYDAGTGVLAAEVSNNCDLCLKETGGPLCVANCPIEDTVRRVWCG